MFPSEALQMIEMKHCISYKTGTWILPITMTPAEQLHLALLLVFYHSKVNCQDLYVLWAGEFFKRVSRALSSERILDRQGAEEPVCSVECRNDCILPWTVIIITTVFRKEKRTTESCIGKCISTLSSFWYHIPLFSSYWHMIILFVSNE